MAGSVCALQRLHTLLSQQVREDAKTKRMREAGLLGEAQEAAAPSIPHFLPFSRWCAPTSRT